MTQIEDQVPKEEPPDGEKRTGDGLLEAHRSARRPTGDVGSRIKQLRGYQGLSIRQLAAEIGLSAAMISQVERGINDPSLDTVRRIAKFFDVPVFDLFQGAAQSDVTVQRADEGLEVATDQADWVITRIGPGNPAIELLEGTLGPGAVSTPEPHSHPARELVLVLEGVVDIEVGKETYRLHGGDSCAFDSRTPHRYRNPSWQRARVLIAVTPPSF